MVLRLTFGMFADQFAAMGRRDQFSYDGLRALYDYCEECLGEDWELDVVGLCCDWTEYSTALDAAKDHGYDPDEDDDEDDQEKAARAWLEENHAILGTDGDAVLVSA